MSYRRVKLPLSSVSLSSGLIDPLVLDVSACVCFEMFFFILFQEMLVNF
jgi:hypothetical protein